MSNSLPSEAFGVSIAVFLYSLSCFFLSVLLISLLIKYGERSKYVTLFSTFTALSTLASLIQQIHFVANWKIVKQGHFECVMDHMKRHGIAFGGAGETWDLVLFYIQFYCHNVMCLNLLFWSISLFNSSWATTFSSLGGRHHNLAIFSKAFSIIWPTFIIGCMQIQSIQHIPVLHIGTTFITMFFSLTVGSILTALVLVKYIRTRRLIAECSNRGEWWASTDADDSPMCEDFKEPCSKRSRVFSSRRRSIYDRALVTRFTICFVIMAVFEVVIIFFTLYQVDNNAEIAQNGEPDLSVDTAITETLLFIPGVSASLLAFLVFGTTKSWRKYRDLLFGGCTSTRQRLPDDAKIPELIIHHQL